MCGWKQSHTCESYFLIRPTRTYLRSRMGNLRYDNYVKPRRSEFVASGKCRCGRTPALNRKQCSGCISSQEKSDALVREEVFLAYGGPICACCGETERVFLSIDHIHGGGAKHRRELLGENKGGIHFYRKLKKQKWPKGYQVLCYNCQIGKYRLGECPHGRQ